MKQVLLVGLGGFLGAIARYGVAVFVTHYFQNARLPYHTLAVNIVGCFFIGLFGCLLGRVSVGAAELKLVLIVGLLGGFTTFSAFGNDTMLLFRKGNILMGLAYIMLSVFCGLIAVWLGHKSSQIIM